MKKILFALLLLASTSVLYAAPDVSKALANFKAAYPSATRVNWKQTDDFYTVQFVVNNQLMQEYYDLDGYRMATTRNITKDSLPAAGLDKLVHKYPGFVITEAIEYTDENDHTSYYATMQKGTDRFVAIVYTNGLIGFFKNLPR